MKRIAILALLLPLVLAPAAFAGGDHRCDKSTDECLTALSKKIQSKGWVGIETEKVAEGQYKITEVVAGGPAAAAGLRAGDVLVGLNGVRFASGDKESIKAAKKSLAVGVTAQYMIERRGKAQQVAVTLGEVPREVMAQWIGEHMLDQHAYVAAGG
jgi:predicted metalloprotease with PDZ domain